MHKLFKQAFTLIELLVVIAIIGILSGLIIVSIGGMTTKATIAKSQIFSNSLRNSLMMNMIGEWNFDNLTIGINGTTINDSWSQNNGVLSTGDALDKLKSEPECFSGKCLSPDGVDDYIDYGNNDAFNLTNTGTVSIWAYIPSSWTTGNLYPDIVSKGASYGWDSNGWSLYVFRDKRIGLTVRNGASINISQFTNTITDQWTYIVGTWNGSNVIIYQNSIIKNSIPQTINAPITSDNVLVGQRGGHYFKGLIDEVRIYNVAMPTSKIKEQYYVGLNNLLVNGEINQEEYQGRIGELAINQP